MKRLTIKPVERTEKEAEEEKELLALFKQHPEMYQTIQGFKLTNREVKSNFPTLLGYYEDLSACEHCPGLEKCPKSFPGFQIALELQERGIIKPTYKPCYKKTQSDHKKGYFIKRDFPEEWYGLPFSAKTIDVSETRSEFFVLAAKIKKHELSRWLYLKSDPQGGKMGKSFLLALFANEIAKTNPGVAYINTKETVELLRAQSIKEKQKFENNITVLQNCPFLVFDNFGSESKTEYVFNKIISPILIYRADNDLLTAFSSAYSFSYVMKGYSYKTDKKAVNELEKKCYQKISKEIDITGASFYGD